MYGSGQPYSLRILLCYGMFNKVWLLGMMVVYLEIEYMSFLSQISPTFCLVSITTSVWLLCQLTTTVDDSSSDQPNNLAEGHPPLPYLFDIIPGK